MKLNFDTRLSLAFLFGMAGLIEQAALQVLGIPPSKELVGAFLGLMTVTIGAGFVRGARNERDASHPPGPVETQDPERPHGSLPEHEARDG